MTDLTEREREARDAMVNLLRRYAEIEHPHRDHPALAWKFDRDVESDLEDLDAYRDAIEARVRAATIAKVREKVEAIESHVYADDQTFFVWHNDLLAALAQLEQSDAE